jgi:hypothetical protein
MNLGMRGKDLRATLEVARLFNVIILIRQTNESSLGYIGKAGFYPKPAMIKAKTADKNPSSATVLVSGLKQIKTYEIAGLVVHPDFQPDAYNAEKREKARDCWRYTMETLASSLIDHKVELTKPDTWQVWGIDRQAVKAPKWQWRVDVDPKSNHFGCLQIKSSDIPWSYIHGDYDLKDVIVLGNEQDNRRFEGVIDGVQNFMPLLKGMEFSAIQKELNFRMGTEMIQHGSEAQFAWHGDEPIIVAYPDKSEWHYETLLSAETVQSWYMKINREVLGKQGRDWLRDSSRAFHYGPQGMFKPGHFPGKTWG